MTKQKTVDRLIKVNQFVGELARIDPQLEGMKFTVVGMRKVMLFHNGVTAYVGGSLWVKAFPAIARSKELSALFVKLGKFARWGTRVDASHFMVDAVNSAYGVTDWDVDRDGVAQVNLIAQRSGVAVRF